VPKIKYKGVPVEQVIRTQLSPDQIPKSESSLAFLEQFQDKKHSDRSDDNHAQAERESREQQGPSLIEELDEQDVGAVMSGEREPKYQIVYRGNIEMTSFTNDRNKFDSGRPKEIIVKVELPNVCPV
jgi:hypothetical protein